MQDEHLAEQHFKDEQWLLYLGGVHDPGASDVERHTESCPDCKRFLTSMTAIRAALRVEASRLRDAVRVSDGELEAMFERCLGQLRAEANLHPQSRPRWTPREAMLLLRLLVEPICGPGMAGATISLAVQRSAAGRDESVTERNWTLFVSNLSDSMASVCGSAAGRLVSRAGFFLVRQDG